jgi:hypothetical protein
MRHSIIFSIILFSCLTSAPAQSGRVPAPQTQQAAPQHDMTVFGIALGQDFTIQECPKRKIGRLYMYSPSSGAVCFERLFDKVSETGPVVNDSVSIRFPAGETPELMTGLGMIGAVIDGKLEGIGFNTFGIRTQDSDIETLKKKYGDPTTLAPTKVTTRIGASFDAITATWDLPDLYVSFKSAASSIDSGLVNIDTRKGKEHRDRLLNDLNKKKRSL